MRKFSRGNPPHFLEEKWEGWGKKYASNRTNNSGFTFQWPTLNGQKLNKILEPHLAALTDHHCSYCDHFPIRSREDSIDHFRPKSIPEFYVAVCQWDNLYYCCQNCQQFKLEQYHPDLLRPDSDAYSYDHFFIYSFRDHTLSPNPARNETDQKKAQITIDIFGLNEEGNPAARRINLERYEAKKILAEDIFLNDFAFRFTLLG